MKKRPIPPLPSEIDGHLRGVLDAMRENIEVISGQRGARIKKLSSSATTEDIIGKINEIIDVLQ